MNGNEDSETRTVLRFFMQEIYRRLCDIWSVGSEAADSNHRRRASLPTRLTGLAESEMRCRAAGLPGRADQGVWTGKTIPPWGETLPPSCPMAGATARSRTL